MLRRRNGRNGASLLTSESRITQTTSQFFQVGVGGNENVIGCGVGPRYDIHLQV